MQMSEIRFAAMTIAQVLNFLPRSTGLSGTVCVLKQPHDSARFQLLPRTGTARVQAHRALRLADRCLGERQDALAAFCEYTVEVDRVCRQLAVSLLNWPQARYYGFGYALFEIAVAHPSN